MRYSLLLLFMGFLSCTTRTVSEETKRNLTEEFKDYWFSGKAEITSYHLKQSRYGEVRDGYVTTIFVTEDFSRSQQVKLDKPAAHPEDIVKVLKLNSTRKFTTGIYPYSMMTSVFTPLYSGKVTDLKKITFSSQDWCGQSWFQVNERQEQLFLRTFSYFQSRGDQEKVLEDAITEDAIWNYLRYSPEYLPEGKVKIIPAMTFFRFTHHKIQAYQAECKLVKGDSLSIYTIRYPELGRTLWISFTRDFPYKIHGWKETWAHNGQVFTTSASANERIRIDYWNKHSKKDSILRTQLGLP